MELKRNVCVFRIFNQYNKQHLPCKCALSRHYITFNRTFNNLSTLSTFPQTFPQFQHLKKPCQKMFNIIQHTFNKTFNTVTRANTRFQSKLTLSTAPTTTSVYSFNIIYYYINICNMKTWLIVVVI